MLRKNMVVLFTILIVSGACNVLSARESNVKTKTVEIKSSFIPASTRVAVLLVANAAEEKKYVKGEIDQSLVIARNMITQAFIDRGFVVIRDEELSKITTRLEPGTNNAIDFAKQLNADVVVDCSVKELYTFISNSFVQRMAGVAVVNLKIYSMKDGYMLNDDFLSRRDGPPGMLGWATKNSEMREKALKAVVNLALDGLLKPYAISDKITPTAPEIVQKESKVDTVDLTEKVQDAPKVIELVSPPAPTQPEISKGPNYIKVNGYALVPLKNIAEWFGATIDFEKKSGIITIKLESNTVSLKLKSDIASVNGKLVQLSTFADERNGTTFVPLRFVSEAFAAKIKLDSSTGEIWIEHPSRSAVLVLSK